MHRWSELSSRFYLLELICWNDFVLICYIAKDCNHWSTCKIHFLCKYINRKYRNSQKLCNCEWYLVKTLKNCLYERRPGRSLQPLKYTYDIFPLAQVGRSNTFPCSQSSCHRCHYKADNQTRWLCRFLSTCWRRWICSWSDMNNHPIMYGAFHPQKSESMQQGQPVLLYTCSNVKYILPQSAILLWCASPRWFMCAIRIDPSGQTQNA